MKRISFIILITIGFVVSINGQNTLSIKAVECAVKMPATSFIGRDFQLFRNDSLIRKKAIRPNRSEDYIFNDLAKGNYELRFISMFGDTQTIPVKIKRKKTRYKICIDDYYPNPNKGFIYSLGENDTLVYALSGYGCEPYDGGTITITKINNKYKGIFSKEGKVLDIKWLNNKDLKKIKEIEDKIFLLKQFDSEGFSMTYIYEILLNGNQKLMVKDGTYDWNGFVFLTEKIFKLKER